MRTCRNVVVALLGLVAGGGSVLANPVVIDFEDVTLPDGGFTYGGPGSADDSVPQTVLLSSGSATFRTTITRYPPYEYWSGFAFSNQADTTTNAWTNQYSSFAAGGVGGSGNFAVANLQSYDPNPLFNLPAGMRPMSLKLVNTTYTALTMRDGDAYNFSSGQYGAGDYLSVTFTGHSLADGVGSTTGAATFFLADFRAGKSAIINQWTDFDLTALGNASSVSIAFDSSDVGAFGINTPTYVAIDNLTITAVPEPATAVLLACGGAVAWGVRRRARTA
ncbi:MAG: DUF4465 domain-containing protein [Planctomycetota bacterium]